MATCEQLYGGTAGGGGCFDQFLPYSSGHGDQGAMAAPDKADPYWNDNGHVRPLRTV